MVFRKTLPKPAGGQQHGARLDRSADLRPGSSQTTAPANAVIHQQIGGGGVAAERDVGQRRGFAIQRARDLAAGGIAVRVQNAVAAVRAFAREGELAALAVELRAPLDQLLNRGRALFHQRVHRGAIAQAVAGDTGCPASCSATSSSSLSATAMPPCAYSEEDSRRLSFATTSTVAGLGQFDGRAQPGDAGADDKKVRIHWLLRSYQGHAESRQAYTISNGGNARAESPSAPLRIAPTLCCALAVASIS